MNGDNRFYFFLSGHSKCSKIDLLVKLKQCKFWDNPETKSFLKGNPNEEVKFYINPSMLRV